MVFELKGDKNSRFFDAGRLLFGLAVELGLLAVAVAVVARVFGGAFRNLG